MPKKPSKPHDEFFKATFGRIEIALDYLLSMLPATLLQELDLSKLKRINGSFVSPALKETFSDVVYQSPLIGTEQSVLLSFIIEHKSKPESRPHFQLLRYMLDFWEEQLKQHKQKKQKSKAILSPIIPILVYQGQEKWEKPNMSSYFGKELPLSLLPFLPQFDYIFTHVTAMSDAQILELKKGLLINTFLMMKHIWNPEYILQHPGVVFINLAEPRSPQDFIVIMLAYFYKNSELARERIQHFIQILPETLNQSAMSTYDMIKQEGYDLGVQNEAVRGEEKLAKERLRAEEERQRAEEERLRAEEEHRLLLAALQREEEVRQRAEEERQRIDNAILNLHLLSKMQPAEIAVILSTEVGYVEELILKNEQNVSS